MNDNNEKTGIHSAELFESLLPMIEEGQRAMFTVTGMSMWPFICHGRDHVIIEACDPASIHVGDIILFQTQVGNYMLHRVTALRSGVFETTGDANCFRDGWFPRDCVKARVASIQRKGKTINCTALSWRLVFACWRRLFPIRKFLLCLLMRIGKLKVRVRK